MPLFIDRHRIPGVTPQQLADAHRRDVEVETAYGVHYLTYWFEEDTGSVFCLAEGPDKATLEAVHREAHGFVADHVIEVGDDPINSFLGPPPAHPLGTPYSDSAVRTIVFTDICDSTAQTLALTDEGFMEVLREHDRVVREAIATFEGREVKHTGDGIMASFASTTRALDAAIAVQRALRASDSRAPIDVRIGIAVGEPVTENEDLFGAAVQLAARLCASAAPGAVKVSSAVRDICVGKRYEFGAASAHDLKGFAEPVAAYELVVQES